MKNQMSAGLGIAVLLISAVMMRPSLTAVLCLIAEAILLFLMRAVAQIEGRKQ